jgi:S1-C subfamily serine protease
VLDMDHNWLTYQIGVRPGDRLVEVNGQPVASASEVRAAWGSPLGNRIRVTLERDGTQVNIDEPLPQTEEFIVPVERWRENE